MSMGNWIQLLGNWISDFLVVKDCDVDGFGGSVPIDPDGKANAL
jgi:hypothetical protein